MMLNKNDNQTMNEIVALIPAYNEGAHIQSVVEQVKAFLPVLVIDDGSRDDTVRLARGAGADVLRQVPNQGKGAALRAGFRQAIHQGCQAAITLDADGQHDPQEIPRFLAAYAAAPAELIIGARRFSQMPFPRNLSNTLGRWMFNWALGQDIPDNQSGYRLIGRRLMEALLDSSEQGFEFEVEMIAVCLKRGYPLAWVPIRTIYGSETSHIKPIPHIKNFVRVVRKTRKLMRS
jgi:glycosyltransferase involved in cell wall biosynthesis